MAGVALATGIGFLLLRRRPRGVSVGPAQQSGQPGERKAPGHELSGDRHMAEIGDERVNAWVSELPAGQNPGRWG